jgi:hypothetical protein
MRFIIILYCCLFAGAGTVAQPAPADTGKHAGGIHKKDSTQLVNEAIAAVKKQNKNYWKAIKLVMLCALAAALLLMQWKSKRKR